MKKLLSTAFIIVFVTIITPLTLFAQENKIAAAKKRILADPRVSAVSIAAERQTPALIMMDQRTESYGKPQVKNALSKFLAVRQGIDEQRLEKETRSGNTEVMTYQQFFKGIKVDRATFKAQIIDGKLSLLNGAWYDIPTTMGTTATLSREQCLGLAKIRINAAMYMADLLREQLNITSDPAMRQTLQKEMQEVDPGGELVFVKNFNQPASGEVRLVYKFNIYAAKPLSRSWVYVDAHTGEIILVDAIIKHVNENPVSTNAVPTTVQTRYAGSRTIQVKRISGNDPNSGLPLLSSNPAELYVPGSLTYALIDDTRGNGIETYDLNGIGGLPINVAPLYAQGKSFTDVDNNWTLPEHKRGGAAENENDDIAWDAHWGAGVVYDYWKAKHNRLSFDGADAKIKSFIHSGLAFDNAFWNGSVMTYGDGSGTTAMGFKPLTSLDVCGHEIGHGVCEFTSNLVYAKESGAMNEGFSDIWASCIEYFAIKTIDPAMASFYKPFYIGEQISASPSAPLRRMDNPKAAGNPDTYGGENWTSQDCSPTLANDQCGVHNNSGLLNKWFYLLTVGSGAGSGPDAIYAGEDDSVNDAVTTGPIELQHGAQPYQVNGQGFAVSERVTYLTELLLTTTATFAEAREVSIAVATNMSGNPCSPLVESVTNAWFAVGVGSKFVKPCTITYGFVKRNGAAVSEEAATDGCSAVKTFPVSVVLPPNSTANLVLSGSANFYDYAVQTSSLANNTANIVTRNFDFTIKDDASVEGDEFIQLNLTVTNTGSSSVNNAYKLTILDDDVVPVIGNGERTLLIETFTRADGFADPAGWKEILELPEAPDGDPLASGKNQWGIFGNKLAVTGKEGTTGLQLPAGTYNSNSSSQTLVHSPLLDARGLSLVTLKFDYTIQGELDPAGAVDDPENLPVFDYMAIAYSLDGLSFTELNTGDFKQYASVLPASGTITGNLPASLANKQFYIAFRWFNDTNAGGPVSAAVDNVTVTAASRKIEDEAGQGGRTNISPATEVYFYSTQDGELVTRVKNNSTKDFGCTYAVVEKSGNAAFNLYQSNQGLHKVSDKVVRVETALSFKAATTISLYFSEAQLQALETITGRSRNNFVIYHVQGIAYTSASNNNTKQYAPVVTNLPGVGAYFTISHSERANGSYALGAQVSTLFVKGADVSGSERLVLTDENLSWKISSVSPNPVRSDAIISLQAPASQNIYVMVVNELGQRVMSRAIRVPAGVSQVRIPAGLLRTGRYFTRISDEKGRLLDAQSFIKH